MPPTKKYLQQKYSETKNMELITEEIKKALPKLYSQEDVEDPIAHVKFFDPCGSFTWFILEYDGEDILFAFVRSHLCPQGELGYVSVKELQSVRNRFGLGMERDIHWEPRPLSQCR